MRLDVEEIFERNADEFLKFDQVAIKRHSRPDICAFFILADLANSGKNKNIVSCAEHDLITLSVTPDDFHGRVTEGDLVDLMRCGVIYDAGEDCFQMLI